MNLAEMLAVEQAKDRKGSMDLPGAVKAFQDGFGKTLGENAGKLLWGAFAVGGPLVTWLTAPTVYRFQLTRIEATVGALSAVVLLAATSWLTRRVLTRRGKYHLTPIGSMNRWGATKPLADGSINAQFMCELVARNLTDSMQRLIVAKMLKPSVGGRVVNAILDGPAGTELLAGESKAIRIHVLVSNVTTLPQDEHLEAVFSIANDEGHEERVTVPLWGMAQSRTAPRESTPTGAA